MTTNMQQVEGSEAGSKKTPEANSKETLGTKVGCTLFVLIFVGIYHYFVYKNLAGVSAEEQRALSSEVWKTFFGVLIWSSLVVGAMTLVITAQTLFSRWRKVNVFISYKHDHLPLVEELRGHLSGRWLRVRFVSFAPVGHDELLEKVRTEISNADAVVVLPGSERSFVDEEIFAASVLKMVVVFLKIEEGQTTPDTALKGYPVFDLGRLRTHDFRPLRRFLLYVGNSWRDSVNNYARTSMTALSWLGGLAVASSIVIFPVIDLLLDVILLFSYTLHARISMYTWTGFPIIVALTFTVAYLYVAWGRLRAIKVARQLMITGNLTYEVLEEGLDHLAKDRAILQSLERKCLPVRHEEPSAISGA